MKNQFYDRMKTKNAITKKPTRFPSKKALQDVLEKLEVANRRHALPYSSNMMSAVKAEAQKQDYLSSLKAEYDLITKGLAKIVEHETYLRLQLTKDGFTHQLMQEILQTKETNQPISCLVSFDIPEDVRFIRDWLREFLKAAGFSKQQRSVWCSQKDVAAKLNALFKHLKINEWVNVHITLQEKSETETSAHSRSSSRAYSERLEESFVGSVERSLTRSHSDQCDPARSAPIQRPHRFF